MTALLSRNLAVFFALLTVAELLSLTLFAPLDAACARWIQGQRSCELDYFAFVVKDRPLLGLLVTSGLVLLLLCLRRRWDEARHAVLVVLVGGFLCELLKAGFERPRPSVLPSLIVGNSFPSGHVTTALLVAGTLGFLLVRGNWSAWAKTLGLSALMAVVSVTMWQRLYLGRHWLSDVVGSLLFVGSWLFCVLPRPQLLSLSRRSMAVAVCLFVGYGGVYLFPGLRIALPSALTAVGTPVFTVSFGEEESHGVLRGAWGERAEEPAGPITWMTRGEASVEMWLPEQQAYLLKIAIRPMLQSKAFACFPLEVRVNQQYVETLFLYRGWREYTLRLDPRWLLPGANTISFRLGVTFPESPSEQRTVAFRYLHLLRERG